MKHGENSVSLHRLSEEEYVERMLPVFQSVFEDTQEDTIHPFSDKILRKGILYHIEPRLSLNELNALIEAGQLIGDTAVWISILDKTSRIYYPQTRETVVFERAWSDHWIFPFNEPNDYSLANDLSLTNAHYSPTGQWGMLRYIDGYGFIGGSEVFLERYYANLGVSEVELCRDFLHDMRVHKVEEAEIFALFSHLYGGEVARLRMAQL